MTKKNRSLINKLYMIQATLDSKDESETILEDIFPDTGSPLAITHKRNLSKTAFILRAMSYCGTLSIIPNEVFEECEST